MTFVGIPDVITDLRPLLATWRIDAANYIRDNLQQVITVASDSTWIHAEGDRYEKSNASLILKQESCERLRELPSYLALDQAAQGSDALAPMMGRLVGTGRHASRFSTWTLANAFLPRIIDLVIGRMAAFDQCYEAVNRQLVEQEIEYEATCPIQGIGFESESMRLALSLAIERLSTDEVCRALEAGAIPTMLPDRFNASDSNSFALKKTIRVPVTVNGLDQEGPTDGDAAVSEQFIQLLKTFEDVRTLQQCLSLMTDKRIQVSAVLIAAKEGGFLRSDTGTQLQVISATWMPDSRLLFDLPMCVELQRAWQVSRGGSLSGNKAIGMAWRRLAFATQRALPEDRLLDVFIAAEAFYLRNTNGMRTRGGIAARIAECAAEWSAQTLPGWSIAEVHGQMKSGYNVRSAVVHGSEPKAKDLLVKGKQGSLNELVQATEAIVRAGLRKAIQQLPESPSQLSISGSDIGGH
jgi:hypothetical protein